MKMIKKKSRILSAVAAGIGAVGLMAVGVTGAHALTYSPTPAVDGSPLTVTSSSTYASGGTYRVGICTVATYTTSIPGVSAPACAGYSGNLTPDGSGVVSGSTLAIYEFSNLNDHRNLGGTQPTNFDCDVANSCEVILVNHVTKAIEERSYLAF